VEHVREARIAYTECGIDNFKNLFSIFIAALSSCFSVRDLIPNRDASIL
jgi:hypothetical protein